MPAARPRLWTSTTEWKCPRLSPGDQLLFGGQIDRFESLAHAILMFTKWQEACGWNVVLVAAATEAFVETAAVTGQRQALDRDEHFAQWADLRAERVREGQDARRRAHAEDVGPGSERHVAWQAARDKHVQRSLQQAGDKRRSRRPQRNGWRSRRPPRNGWRSGRPPRNGWRSRRPQAEQAEQAEQAAAQEAGLEAACISRDEALRGYPEVPPTCFANYGAKEVATSCCFWCRCNQPRQRLQLYSRWRTLRPGRL